MLTQEYLKSILDYDRDTGIFTWKVAKAENTVIGSAAGNRCNEYIVIGIDYRQYTAQRLAWLYEYGEMPQYIDHINHDGIDNRIDNLRNVSHQENMKNKLQYGNNSSGVTGVSWCNTYNRWKSRISIDGKRISLGTFTEFHEAVNARKNAEVLYGYHENHGKTLEEIQGAEYE